MARIWSDLSVRDVLAMVLASISNDKVPQHFFTLLERVEPGRLGAAREALTHSSSDC
jgi:hypothetical protein